MTVALVACASTKAGVALPAAELYRSALFQKASRWASSRARRWFVLSARHGLVDPETVLMPYEQTLSRMPAADRLAWSEDVLGRLLPLLEPGEPVLLLAGRLYRENLVPVLALDGREVLVPMQGLGIGQQLQFLTTRL